MLYDIAIIGAGPGGSASALSLKDANLKIVLLEKDTFPRDKVCGDAIPGKTFKVMRQINPEWEEELFNLQEKEIIKSTSFTGTNGNSITLNWVLKAYNSTRLQFDHLLFKMVKKHTSIDILENFKVAKVEKVGEQFTVTNQKGTSINAKLIIACDGANSVISRQLSPQKTNRNHHSSAVRAYVENIKGIEAFTNEVFVIKKFHSGYFWIFPVNEKISNIGFGMLSKQVADKRINLRKALLDIIHNDPILKPRFEEAKVIGKVVGFGLPLGSLRRKLGGDRFMLVGDAGSLIDPLAGHGIDNAILSGHLAAKQAIQCFEKNQFDYATIKHYEDQVYQKLGKDLQRNYYFMRLLGSFPSVINFCIFIANNAFLRKVLLKIAFWK